MKKIIAGLVLALMVIALPVGLVGCKKGITGTYKFAAIEATYEADYTGHKYTKEELAEMKESMFGESEDQFILNKGGKGIYKMILEEGDGDEIEFTWKREGNEITFHAEESDGDDMVAELKNGKLYMAFQALDGVTLYMVYKK